MEELDVCDIVETDAVHHRLASRSLSLIPVFGRNYQCYDCSFQFDSLMKLESHCQQMPEHSREVCLKCNNCITV